MNTLHRDESATELRLNEIGRVRLRTTVPLFADEYRRNRTTGGFIVIDEGTNRTVGAGMIVEGWMTSRVPATTGDRRRSAQSARAHRPRRADYAAGRRTPWPGRPMSPSGPRTRSPRLRDARSADGRARRLLQRLREARRRAALAGPGATCPRADQPAGEDDEERRIIAEVLAAGGRHVSEVMVPRTRVVFLDADRDVAAAVRHDRGTCRTRGFR